MRLLPRPLLAALALLSCLAPPALADTQVETATKDSLREWVAFLRLPNITKRSTAEIRANADWIEEAFQRYGYTSRQLEDGIRTARSPPSLKRRRTAAGQTSPSTASSMARPIPKIASSPAPLRTTRRPS